LIVIGAGVAFVTVDHWVARPNSTVESNKQIATREQGVVPERAQTALPTTQARTSKASTSPSNGQSTRAHLTGNNNAVGTIAQEGTNNIAQIGNNSQATIEAKPLVRSMSLELQLICELREGSKPPNSPVVFMFTTGSGASFVGLGRAASLVPSGQRTVDSLSGRLVFQESFGRDETGG
jgi:hypothetical protein